MAATTCAARMAVGLALLAQGCAMTKPGADPAPFEEPDGRFGYRTPGGPVAIPPRFTVALPFSGAGTAFAADDKGWALIDRDGRVLLRPFVFDNGPDDFHEGLARFVEGGKVGFFSPEGKVVVPARFDFAQPFEGGRARACVGCERRPSGEHWSMEGGRWFAIDKEGRELPDQPPAPPPAERPAVQRFGGPGEPGGEPVQQPLGGGLGELMAQMQAEADQVIAGVEQRGESGEGAFRQGALLIYCAMRPRFGPANGWLFNERNRKLRALATACRLEHPPEVDLERVAAEVEQLEHDARDLGLRVARRGANRAELLWTPAEGVALTLSDPSREVDWKPAYAGTPAGPDVPAVKRNPALTLFLHPHLAGKAERNLVAREQPGEPAFATPALVAFTLQPAQSNDVEEEAIRARLVARLRQRAGLCDGAEGGTPRPGTRFEDGLLRCSGGPPPPAGRCPLLVRATSGARETLELVVGP